MSRSRFTSPDQLPGATAFSTDPQVRGAINIVTLLKSQGWVGDELRRACDLSKHWGRGREPGDWILVMVAFTVSGQIDIQPWHDQTSLDLWAACGFVCKPSYHTAYRRLRELEHCQPALICAIARLVQRARSNDRRVGAHVHVDGTEDETHAALIHDCQPDEPCPYRQARAQRRARRARRPVRASTLTARRDREAENTRPTQDNEPAAPPATVGGATRKAPGGTTTVVADGTVQIVERNGRLFKRIRQGGCWYRTSDLDAGIRAYTGPRGAKRFWHGYYNQKAIDHFTGAVIFPGTYSASLPEHKQLPDLYQNTSRIIGRPPETLIADKGQSVASVFKLLTSHGTAPVIPWRPHGQTLTRQDHEAYDRHGVPRCRHCGAPTTFVRFHPGTHARIIFKCALPVTDNCEKEQSIGCATDWRLLLPLWRTDPLYQELRHSMGSYEATHDYWRDRYRVAADTLANRPKIISIAWHRLRALTATLIEWLRICDRQGWLAGPCRNHNHPTRRAQQIGINNATSLMRSRVLGGLMAAYGTAAHKLGLGPPDPPSRQAATAA